MLRGDSMHPSPHPMHWLANFNGDKEISTAGVGEPNEANHKQGLLD